MPDSAPNLNQVVLVGRLTHDPILRDMPDGRSVCGLRLPSTNDQPPLYIDVATFGPGADACAAHLAKGRQITVTGRLVLDEWESKDGVKRSRHRVLGHVHFGGREGRTDER